MTEKSPENADAFTCIPCDFTCYKLSEWTRHINTRKHLDGKPDFPEKRKDYKCESCDVICGKLSKWNKHISTMKHIKNVNIPEKRQTVFACVKCNKVYKSRGGLWNHESKCNHVETQLINRMLNDNIELRNFIIEQTKTIEKILIQNTEIMSKSVDTNKIVNNNSVVNNNKFNINIFLNEQCKDAINFSDFVKNIEISREDLENTAQLGFVSGVSKILMDNLKQLGINERPIHCTDKKRETMYIKEENKWTKEPDDSKLQKAIQTVSCKSMQTLQQWKLDNPDYQDMDSAFSLRCLDMQKNSIAGSDRDVYYPKVIHVLAKETIVMKEP